MYSNFCCLGNFCFLGETLIIFVFERFLGFEHLDAQEEWYWLKLQEEWLKRDVADLET